jgi:hypothetical protein
MALGDRSVLATGSVIRLPASSPSAPNSTGYAAVHGDCAKVRSPHGDQAAWSRWSRAVTECAALCERKVVMIWQDLQAAEDNLNKSPLRQEVDQTISGIARAMNQVLNSK